MRRWVAALLFALASVACAVHVSSDVVRGKPIAQGSVVRALFTPTTLDADSAGTYLTVGVPPGVLVIGVDVVLDGVHVVGAGRMGPMLYGCGPVGCRDSRTDEESGDMRAVRADTGLWFSEDPRTAVGPRNGTAYTEWDALQVEGLGSTLAVTVGRGNRRGNPLLVRDPATRSWVGSGSLVAGPDTYYPLAFACHDEESRRHFQVGPWRRLACAGARAGGIGRPVPSRTDSDSLIVDTDSAPLTEPVSVGRVVSPDSPLPLSTRAIRAALGPGQRRSLRVTLRVVDAAQLLAAWGEHASVCAFEIASPARQRFVLWREMLVRPSHCAAAVATLVLSGRDRLPSCDSPAEAAVEVVTPRGDAGPFVYTWSDAALAGRVRTLPLGNHSVVVASNSTGQVGYRQYLVAPPLRVVPSVAVTDGSACPMDAVVSVHVAAGGVPPYTYSWSHAPTSPSARQGHLGAIKCGLYNVTATDAQGCWVAHNFTVPCRVGVILDVIRANCTGAFDTFLNMTATRGRAPFRYMWSYGIVDQAVAAANGHWGGTLTDADGCYTTVSTVVNAKENPFTVELNVRQPDRWGGSGAAWLVPRGGDPPYEYEWSDGRRTRSMDPALPGSYHVFVSDSVCLRRFNFTIVEAELSLHNGEPACAAYRDCERYYDGNMHVYINCLRSVAEPIMWDPRTWDVCAVRALLAIARRLERFHGPLDYSSSFVGLMAAEALDHCLAERPHCDNITWTMVAPFMQWQEEVRVAFNAFVRSPGTVEFGDFKRFVVRLMMEIKPSVTRTDVLLLGPWGFRNEYVFGPSLHFPSRKLRVASLQRRRDFFTSDGVIMVNYPWGLLFDIGLASPFVKEVLQVLTPRVVLPGDTAGIMVLSRLAVGLEKLTGTGCLNVDGPMLRSLKASLRWPPEYPPESLSKLIKGHEAFAPRELVLEQRDLLRTIAPNVDGLLNASEALGDAWLKREHSEAGSGVLRLPRSLAPESKAKVLESVMQRKGDLSLIDLDIQVRVFLQQEVIITKNPRPLGLRFYAHHGRLIAGHMSEVVINGPNWGVAYQTIRDPRVERATVDFVRAVNYTGFGAAWWWKDNSGRPFLVDFNARLERHACLGPILTPELLELEPCFLFQRFMAGDLDLDAVDAPRFLPAGLRYMEPMRALQGNLDSLMVLLGAGSAYKWNLWAQDGPLISMVHREIELNKVAIAAATKRMRAIMLNRRRTSSINELAAMCTGAARHSWTAVHADALRGELDLRLVDAMVPAVACLPTGAQLMRQLEQLLAFHRASSL